MPNYSDLVSVLPSINSRFIFHSLLCTTGTALSAILATRYFVSRAWKPKSLPTKLMEGKVIIVTGANTGIGFNIVKELIHLKATVILACRDLEKGKNAIDKILVNSSGGEMVLMQLDLASFESIRAFAKKVLEKFPKIHCLVNNAGVSIPVDQNVKTKEGYEVHFGVNHLGHFLLTNLLIDRIQKSNSNQEHSKVVIVSSSLLESGKIDFDNLNGEKGFVQKGHNNPAYCNSKLMNYYFAAELYLKYADKGVDVSAVCPGWCYTDLFRYSNITPLKKLMVFPIALMFMRSANDGAQSVMDCIVKEEQPKHFPPIFRNFKPYETKHQFDDVVSKKLWDMSARLCNMN